MADQALTWAYQIFLDGLCPQCGSPLTVCRDEGTDVDVREDVCQVAAALEQYRDDNKDLDPGTVLVPVIDEEAGPTALERKLAAEWAEQQTTGRVVGCG